MDNRPNEVLGYLVCRIPFHDPIRIEHCVLPVTIALMDRLLRYREAYLAASAAAFTPPYCVEFCDYTARWVRAEIDDWSDDTPSMEDWCLVDGPLICSPDHRVDCPTVEIRASDVIFTALPKGLDHEVSAYGWLSWKEIEKIRDGVALREIFPLVKCGPPRDDEDQL